MFINVPPIYIAQAIQTGNANAESSVQTNIQGSGSVSTHIEVSANGEKKVLDSNSPGTYSLQIQSNGNNSNTNDDNRTITPVISLSPTPIATPTPKMKEENETHRPSFLLNLEHSIQNFFSKILHALKPK